MRKPKTQRYQESNQGHMVYEWQSWDLSADALIVYMES